jgi:microcin C transport system substrate-binding protein
MSAPTACAATRAAQTLRVEFLNNSAAFERIILPLRRQPSRHRRRRVAQHHRPAQYEERQEVFDYDIVSGRFVLPLSPSVELRQLFGSDARPVRAPSTTQASPIR